MTDVSWFTQADRARWQRQAVRELATILDAHGDLPLIAWTVGPAGGGLTGRISGLAPASSVRAVFTAWQQALGLDDVLETPLVGGAGAWLRARARRGGVRVTLTATVIGGEDNGEKAVTS